MKKGTSVTLSLMLAFLFAVSLAGTAFAGHDEMKTVEGDIICLLPDFEKGSVNPVIATAPCNGQPAHGHILVTEEGTVYSLQGLEEGLMKIESSSERKNVQITGRVEGNQRGWVLYVN